MKQYRFIFVLLAVQLLWLLVFGVDVAFYTQGQRPVFMSALYSGQTTTYTGVGYTIHQSGPPRHVNQKPLPGSYTIEATGLVVGQVGFLLVEAIGVIAIQENRKQEDMRRKAAYERIKAAPPLPYICLKEGSGTSAGTLKGQYVWEVPSGIADVPVYYPMTKAEFDTFESWNAETTGANRDIVYAVINRPAVAHGHKDVPEAYVSPHG